MDIKYESKIIILNGRFFVEHLVNKQLNKLIREKKM